jgi:hypothetical protein
MSGPPTKLKAANLWLKTSAAGNVYFAGRLGGVKVLILENRARAGENDPTHHLFFVDGEKREESRAGASAPRAYAQRRAPRPPVRADSVPPLPDDGVDDLWRDGPAP